MNTTAVRRAIYGKLAGDVTLRGLLGAAASGYSQAIYYEVAPQNAAFAFVVFQKQSAIAAYAMATEPAFDNELWLAKGIDHASSADNAEAVQARIAALLNDAALAISGGILSYLRRESDVDYSEDFEGEQFRHAGSLYRLIHTT
jgi:hypothetical protein